MCVCLIHTCARCSFVCTGHVGLPGQPYLLRNTAMLVLILRLLIKRILWTSRVISPISGACFASLSLLTLLTCEWAYIRLRKSALALGCWGYRHVLRLHTAHFLVSSLLLLQIVAHNFKGINSLVILVGRSRCLCVCSDISLLTVPSM